MIPRHFAQVLGGLSATTSTSTSEILKDRENVFFKDVERGFQDVTEDTVLKKRLEIFVSKLQSELFSEPTAYQERYIYNVSMNIFIYMYQKVNGSWKAWVFLPSHYVPSKGYAVPTTTSAFCNSSPMPDMDFQRLCFDVRYMKSSYDSESYYKVLINTSQNLLEQCYIVIRTWMLCKHKETQIEQDKAFEPYVDLGVGPSNYKGTPLTFGYGLEGREWDVPQRLAISKNVDNLDESNTVATMWDKLKKVLKLPKIKLPRIKWR
jgi:hypothetical protein